MEAKLIDGKETIAAWIRENNYPNEQQLALYLSSRVALRTMPEFWSYRFLEYLPERRKSPYSLPVEIRILRASLLAYISGLTLNPIIKNCSFRCNLELANIRNSGMNVWSFKKLMLFIQTNSINVEDVADIIASFDASVHPELSSGVLRQELRMDCERIEQGGSLGNHPLWSREMPNEEEWKTAKASMIVEGYDFWVRLFDAVESGQAQDDALFLNIAMRDDFDLGFWEGTDVQINAKISAIEDEYIKHSFAYT